MKLKEMAWIGSSKKDLEELSGELQDAFGYGLYLAQSGEKHKNAKPLKGFGGADMLELVEQDADGTYRAVYTLKIGNLVCVLHVFQKKSKHGIETPKADMDLIRSRLKLAQIRYKEKK